MFLLFRSVSGCREELTVSFTIPLLDCSSVGHLEKARGRFAKECWECLLIRFAIAVGSGNVSAIGDVARRGILEGVSRGELLRVISIAVPILGVSASVVAANALNDALESTWVTAVTKGKETPDIR